jgi:hypothetical protein
VACSARQGANKPAASRNSAANAAHRMVPDCCETLYGLVQRRYRSPGLSLPAGGCIRAVEPLPPTSRSTSFTVTFEADWARTAVSVSLPD